MATVRNWQLGRDMEYPYEEHHPARQFAFVFNTNRCIGCQTCTMACKSTWSLSRGQEFMWWNNVETKPYGGYPHNWDLKTLALVEEANPGGQRWSENGEDQKKFEGQTIFEAAGKVAGQGQERVLGYLPTDDEWRYPNIYEDTAKGPKGRRDAIDGEGATLPEHKTWFFYLQRICNHCSYPACVAACPRNAIYKRPEDGIVLIDQKRCRGYRKCVEACPYKKPMYRSTTRTSEKCIGCYPRVEGKDPLSGGQPMETRCMSACVGKIRMQGLVDIDANTGDWKEDQESPLYHLVKNEKIALPLYPQFGTEPNGYYIPPRWVPRPYLHQMFGPGVDAAIDNYVRPSRKTMAILQLFRVTQQIIFKYKIEEGPKIFETEVNGETLEIFDDTVIGFDEDGNEITRVTVEEPFHIREGIYANSI